jgi:hypothetical protein
LRHENLAQIDVHRTPRLRRIEPRCDFRAYFIASTTNTYSTMHYKSITSDTSSASDRGDAAGQDAVGGAPPARVEQADDARIGLDQIHGDAVGDGDRQQNAGLGGDVPVETL